MRIEMAAESILQETYGMQVKTCATDMLRKVFQCAETDKCQVG